MKAVNNNHDNSDNAFIDSSRLIIGQTCARGPTRVTKLFERNQVQPEFLSRTSVFCIALCKIIK